MDASGAKAALRGYRLQTLYILKEILETEGTDYVFQPEGKEDLAVYKGEELVRFVQIKAHKDALSISSFKPKNIDSFFRRALKLLKERPGIKAQVVSFGDIGPQITKAWDGDEHSKDQVISSLSSYGITEADLLFDQLEWIPRDETEVDDLIRAKLTETITSGNPSHAFDLLSWWLLNASENRKKITYIDLRDKLTSVGRYIEHIESHRNEWFNTIHPLVDDQKDLDESSLSREFYRGVSVRYSHILKDLDVRRPQLLGKLDDLLQNNKTVILHGASGQGKSALAYRYLKDYVPIHWGFYINRIEDKDRAQSIANAVIGHLSAYDLPVYLYVEVAPRDTNWTQLVKSLLDFKNVKILVSIREEDLSRSAISPDEYGFPAYLPLLFSEEDASQIYGIFAERDISISYPTAKDAWIAFGQSGSLLEYVYLLTQDRTLKSRIASQIQLIREEISTGAIDPQTLQFLYACSVANAFESKIDAGVLFDALGVRDPTYLLKKLKDEYLIRLSDDDSYVIAIHPIRSSFIYEEIYDSSFNPLSKVIDVILKSIDDYDLEGFLLHLFVEFKKDTLNNIEAIKRNIPNTWTGFSAVSRALLWYDISCHVHDSENLITEARSFSGLDGWYLLCPDIMNVFEEDLTETFLNILDKSNPKGAEKARDISNRFKSKKIQFTNLQEWIGFANIINKKPEHDSDWIGLGETLNWFHYLGLIRCLEIDWVFELDFQNTFKSIEMLSVFLEGLYYYNTDTYNVFIEKYIKSIKELFQLSTNTFRIEFSYNNPIAHYIVPHDVLADNSSELNRMSVYRANLLKKIFPANTNYGAKGYGHLIDLDIEDFFDESEKTSILRESLISDQFVYGNVIWRNYSIYLVRPDTWEQYVSEVLDIRKRIVSSFELLKKTLDGYFSSYKEPEMLLRNGGPIEPLYWAELSTVSSQKPSLPKIAVDRWGISSEGTTYDSEKNNNDVLKGKGVIQIIYESYVNSLGNYLTNLMNFYSQSKSALMKNGIIGRSNKCFSDLFESIEDISEHNDRLSVFNFMDAYKKCVHMQEGFKNHFASLVSKDELTKIELKERELFSSIWPLWIQFVYHPKKKWNKNPSKEARKSYEIQKRAITDSLRYHLKNGRSKTLHLKIIDNIFIHDKHSLCIAVDIFEEKDRDFFTEIIRSICEAIRPLVFDSLKYFVFAKEWEQIAIIPTIEGKLSAHNAWIIPSIHFEGNHNLLSSEYWWLAYPREICNSEIQNLNIDLHCISNDQIFDETEAVLSHLCGYFKHLSCFIDLDDVDEFGLSVIDNYLKGVSENLSNDLNSLSLLYEKIKDEGRYSDDIVQRLKSILDYFSSNTQLPIAASNEIGGTLEELHDTIINYKASLINFSD